MSIEEKIIIDVLNLTMGCQREFRKILDGEFFREYPGFICPDKRETIKRVVHSIVNAHVDYIMNIVVDRFGEE